MANVIRSRISTTLLLVGLLASLPAGRSWAQCLGDCDGGGSVGSGELTKIIAIINYCPCASPLVGGLPAGCAAVPGADKQCTNADRNGNNCITAGELTGVIADLLNFPSTGCPPVPTATNTPATATPTTPTVINTATPTHTPVTPPSATPTTPAPTNTIQPTATNTTPPTSTRTNTAPPSSTPTTPAPTNTPVSTATATITPTAVITVTAVCGNGVVDTGEDCDIGGSCIGGDNAGTHCTAETDCVGDGVCEAGSNAFRVCSSNADCPGGGSCIHCKVFAGPYAGGTCAANCTKASDVPFPLVSGIVGADKKLVAGTSGAIVHGNGALPIPPLALNGSQILTIGKPVNGQIPVSIKASSVSFGAIRVLTAACACVRPVVAMTCGGTVLEKNGLPSIDCTPNFIQGTCSVATTQVCNIDTDCPVSQTCVVHTCDGLKPCTYVHGAGNSGSGIIGVNGLDNINLNAFQDNGGYPEPPPPTPPANMGQPILTMRNACSCSTNSDCTPGQTCDAMGRCSCMTNADCLAPSVQTTTPGGICACPNGTSSCATGTTGVCMYEGCVQNSDCPGTQTCKGGGPGSALIVNSSAIAQIVNSRIDPCVIPTLTPAPTPKPSAPPWPFGPDHHACAFNGVDDDPWTARGVPQTLPVTTGFATGYIINVNLTPVPTPPTPAPSPVFGRTEGPWSVIGAPFNVNHLLTPGIPPMTPTPGFTPTPGPYASGAGLASAFTAINQPTTNTMVTDNIQFSK
jgi:hypothetical protein